MVQFADPHVNVGRAPYRGVGIVRSATTQIVRQLQQTARIHCARTTVAGQGQTDDHLFHCTRI